MIQVENDSRISGVLTNIEAMQVHNPIEKQAESEKTANVSYSLKLCANSTATFPTFTLISKHIRVFFLAVVLTQHHWSMHNVFWYLSLVFPPVLMSTRVTTTVISTTYITRYSHYFPFFLSVSVFLLAWICILFSSSNPYSNEWSTGKEEEVKMKTRAL